MTKAGPSGAFSGPAVAVPGRDQPRERVDLADATQSGLHPRLRAWSMVTRISTWQVSDPGGLRGQLEHKRDAIAALPGVVSCHVAWTPDGNGITFAVFSSESSAAAFDALSIFADTDDLISPLSTAAYPDIVTLK